jgi:hypothetical protein
VRRHLILVVISLGENSVTLVHYTDANAVHSILLNQKLWLTDLRFLNDTQELNHGIDKLSNELAAPTHGLFSNYSYADDSIRYLLESFKDEISFGIDEEPIFVFSLSRATDLLSQWRAYGSYAIEFDENCLAQAAIKLFPCVYKNKNKLERAKDGVTDALHIISQDMAENDGCTGIKCLDSLVSLIELAATFKHEGFEEEREVRILTREDKNIKYRSNGTMLVPYIELPISLDCIKAVHVGPMNNQELAYKAMSAFVYQVARDWQNESANIEYELGTFKSAIPFRAK